MALSLAKAREKIQSRIYDTIGTNAAIENVSSSSQDEDDYADYTLNYGSSTAVTLVPFNSVESEDFQPFGELLAGELDMIVPYGETVTNTTRFTYNGVRYMVKQLETYPYQGGSLAYAVRLAKILTES